MKTRTTKSAKDAAAAAAMCREGLLQLCESWVVVVVLICCRFLVFAALVFLSFGAVFYYLLRICPGAGPVAWRSTYALKWKNLKTTTDMSDS